MALHSPESALASRPRRRAESILLRYGCLAGLSLFFVFCLLCSGMTGLGWAAGSFGDFLLATILAAVFTIPYTVLLLWLDRNEKEPVFLLLTAFLWGACVATAISGIVNGTFFEVTREVVRNKMLASQITASISAPFIEELTKGTAVLFLFLLFRKQFDNVLDGVLYGALVGMGFAWFENISYYMAAGASGSALDMIKLSFVRGALNGIGTHAAYTGMTGLGFGLVRVLRRGVLRWLFVPFFWGLAMFAHFSWNTFVDLFIFNPRSEAMTLLVSLPIATLVLQSPFVVLLLIVVAIVWRHENKIIVSYLQGEPEDVVTREQAEALVPARKRMFRSIGRLMSGGPLVWWRHARLDEDLVKLAFCKWHHAADEIQWSPDQDADVQYLRRRILGHRAALAGA